MEKKYFIPIVIGMLLALPVSSALAISVDGMGMYFEDSLHYYLVGSQTSLHYSCQGVSTGAAVWSNLNSNPVISQTCMTASTALAGLSVGTYRVLELDSVGSCDALTYQQCVDGNYWFDGNAGVEYMDLYVVNPGTYGDSLSLSTTSTNNVCNVQITEVPGFSNSYLSYNPIDPDVAVEFTGTNDFFPNNINIDQLLGSTSLCDLGVDPDLPSGEYTINVYRAGGTPFITSASFTITQ